MTTIAGVHRSGGFLFNKTAVFCRKFFVILSRLAMEGETFASFGLHDKVLDALRKSNFHHPTPLQRRALNRTAYDFADVIVEAGPHEGRTTCIAMFAAHCSLSAQTPSNRCTAILADSVERVERVASACRSLDVGGCRTAHSVSCKGNQPKVGDGSAIYVSTLEVLQNASSADCSACVTLIIEDVMKYDPVGLCRLLRKLVAVSPTINMCFFTSESPSAVDYSVRYMLRRINRRYLSREPCPPKYAFLLCQDQFDRADLNARVSQLAHLRRVLILTHNKEVRDLKSHLHQEFGFRTYSIQRNTSSGDRERVLSDFLACDFAILIAMDAFVGVDLMDVDAVIQYYPPQKSMPDEEWRDFVTHLNGTNDAQFPTLVCTLVGVDDLALCAYFQSRVGVNEPILNLAPTHKRFASILDNPRAVAIEKMGAAAAGKFSPPPESPADLDSAIVAKVRHSSPPAYEQDPPKHDKHSGGGGGSHRGGGGGDHKGDHRGGDHKGGDHKGGGGGGDQKGGRGGHGKDSKGQSPKHSDPHHSGGGGGGGGGGKKDQGGKQQEKDKQQSQKNQQQSSSKGDKNQDRDRDRDRDRDHHDDNQGGGGGGKRNRKHKGSIPLPRSARD